MERDEGRGSGEAFLGVQQQKGLRIGTQVGLARLRNFLKIQQNYPAFVIGQFAGGLFRLE